MGWGGEWGGKAHYLVLWSSVGCVSNKGVETCAARARLIRKGCVERSAINEEDGGMNDLEFWCCGEDKEEGETGGGRQSAEKERQGAFRIILRM